MKINIISSGIRWEEKELLIYFRKHFNDVSIINIKDLIIKKDETHLYEDSLIIIRSPSYFFSTEASQLFEMVGANVVNEAKYISLFGRKTATDRWLSKNNIAHIPSNVVFSLSCIDEIESEFLFPLVIKPSIGGFGNGVHKINSREELILAWKYIESYAPVYHKFLYLQRMIDVAYDLRVFMLNGNIVASIKRINNTSFTKNISQGGVGEPHKLNEDEKNILSRIGSKIPIGFFGIDLLIDHCGTVYVCEINAVPLFKETSKISGINIAEQIVKGMREACG